MPTRTVRLSDHYEEIIERALSSGEFEDASQVMHAALQLFEQRRREDEARIAALRAAAKVGSDDLDQGRYTEFKSSEELAAWLDRIGDEVRAQSEKRDAA
jgi:antitoxin ParD1/3/4